MLSNEFLKLELNNLNVNVYDLEGKAVKRIELPKLFQAPVRVDIIRRAFHSIQTARIQPQGRDSMAGKRTTAESWGVGYGVARVPRIKGTSRAALIPQAVGGRRAHPPTTMKKIHERINKKEKKLALVSALAATATPYFVKKRGHVIETVPQVPLIVVDSFEELKRTSQVRDVLIRLGVWPDILRAKTGKRIRAGKGKMRGRRYKKPKSVLIVIKEDKGVFKAARNLPGVDVTLARNLNVELLAPGGDPGRLTIYTESALKEIEELWGDIAWTLTK
mgnify:CR=1 FL=1